jgi:hypothetical protein
MRIAPLRTVSVYPSPNKPKSIPVVPLSKEDSRAIIESGALNQDANQVVYAAAGQTTVHLGGPIGTAASLSLPNGLRLQPHYFVR